MNNALFFSSKTKYFLTAAFMLLIIITGKSQAYSPIEARGYERTTGTLNHAGGSQEILAFLGDFITYNIWNYKSTRKFYGPCGQDLDVSVSESNSYALSWGYTSTSSGKIAGGAGGNGEPSASGEFSQSIATSLGISFASTSSSTLNCKCEARPGFIPIVVVEYDVTEYCGNYTDWGFFSGTDYEFHIHNRTILGYKCEYRQCEQR